MNGLIIINNEQGLSSGKIQKKIQRLKEEFSILKVDIDVVKNDGTLSFIEDGNIKINIKNNDFIIYLDKDKYLARLLFKAGYHLFVSADFIELCDDKMLTHIALSNHDIPMPKTIAGPLIFDSKRIKDISFLDKIEKELSYPLIIKGMFGSLGQNMRYVTNKEELISRFLEMSDQPIIFQQYISSSFGRSVRVMVVDQKIIGAFERYNPHDYRSNYSIDATSKPFLLDEKFTSLTNKIIDLLKIEYAGIDFLFGENEEPILCEINSNAFFEEFEKITQVNAAKAFATMVVDKIKKRKLNKEESVIN
ncbi:MAG: RimK family alpha-L-glutamate ligase [Bacilli bacterium]|jgi:RimK family alpha-L-glutamate ligase|nr:RimK family alpha-L-glutamate ligase [Bacilli bacterium]